MQMVSEQRLDGGVVERRFTLGEIPGILWTPPSDEPAPLMLLGHPGGLDGMYSRLVARARASTDLGFGAVAIELPSNGIRDRLADIEQGRAALQQALRAGGLPSERVIDEFILPLVERAVPEWQQVMDEVLALPQFGNRVGISGGVISVGTRLAAIDPRVAAAGLFAGSFVPRAIVEQARAVTIPVHVLLQWDDEGNDRARALELFDAFGSKEKTLQANLGGHRGVPAYAGDDAARFFARHLLLPSPRR